MFNLLPGQGLGFSPSKELAFGLGAISESTLPIFVGAGDMPYSGMTIMDNAYTLNDERDIIDLLTILFQVIE